LICAAKEKHARDIVVDAHGVERFRPNQAVRHLFEACGKPLALLWILHQCGEISREDMLELHKLLGLGVDLVGLIFKEPQET